VTTQPTDGQRPLVGASPHPVIRLAVLALLGICLCALLSVHIAAPWQFIHDDNGAWFSSTARTHILRGLMETRGQDFFLVRGTEEMRPYLHHPPFISLYLAAVFAGTGLDTPLVARTAIAVLHVLSFLVFLRIAKVILGNDLLPRLWSAFIFAIVPMSVFFGKMPNHEVPGLLFFQLGVLVSLSGVTRNKYSRGNLVVLFLAWLLVPIASWHAALSGLVFVLCFCFVVRRHNRKAFLLTSCSALVGSLLIVIVHLLWANQWQVLTSQHTSFFYWLTVPEGENRIAFWAQSLAHAAKHSRRFYADIPWLLSIAWMIWLGVLTIKRRRPRSTELTVLFMGAGSILYCTVFAPAVSSHAYQQFYLLPFIALSSALGLSELYGRVALRRKALAVLLVVLLSLATLRSASRRLYRLYREPGAYAVAASRAIETQFY